LISRSYSLFFESVEAAGVAGVEDDSLELEEDDEEPVLPASEPDFRA
jgi:hypothetical protein